MQMLTAQHRVDLVLLTPLVLRSLVFCDYTH